MFTCPECSKTFDHPGKLVFHRVSAHGYRASGKGGKGGKATTPPRTPAPSVGATEKEIRDEVLEFTGNVQMGGHFLRGIGVAHLGLAIAGVEVEKGTPGAIVDGGRSWVVRSRAVMAEPLLLDQCKRNLQLFLAIRRVNQFLRGGVAVEVGGGLLAAAAVDAGLSPAVGFMLGPLPIQPIPAVIGDVLAFREAELADQEEARGVSAGNGHRGVTMEDLEYQARTAGRRTSSTTEGGVTTVEGDVTAT